MNPVLAISVRDNVATALAALKVGETIRVGEIAVTVAEAIPRGHKVALREIRTGEAVLKYGSAIGLASARIAQGTHVHTHNVASLRGRGDLAPCAPAAPASGLRIAEPPDSPDNDYTEVPLPESA